MNAEDHSDVAASKVAAAIGEPARARILYSLMDGHARTSTELAVIADVSPSTASVHLHRLRSERLISVVAQGKHRYYSLRGPAVARVLEGLNVLAGGDGARFVPSTPNRLRAARTCYDHMAGTTAVALHDRLMGLGWLAALSKDDAVYDVSAKGVTALGALGIDVGAARGLRRRFAYGCLDWSERRPHVGGAIGTALLELLLRKRWVSEHLDSRALSVTRLGRRELHARFGVSTDLVD
jgi:DNA-binding transcriptional ArsR family regulator